MSEMVRGDTGAMEDGSINTFFEEQATEWGEDDLNIDDVLDGTFVADDSDLGDSPEPTGVQREGTDVVLSRLDNTDPAAAQAMRDMQRRMGQNNNDWNSLRSEVLDLREQLLTRLGGQPAGEEAPVEQALPVGVTQQNMEMFEAMAAHLGYVPRSELEAIDQQKETAATADSYVDGELKAGTSEYGADFGTIDDGGNFTLNPKIQERLDARMAMIQDQSKGVTPLDLFRMEFPNAGRQQRPRRQVVAGGQQGAPGRPNPNVLRRSGPGGGPGREIDIRAGEATPEQVLDRAWALSKRDLTQ